MLDKVKKSRVEFTKEIKQGKEIVKGTFLQSMELIILALILTEPLRFDKLYFVHNSACVASKEQSDAAVTVIRPHSPKPLAKCAPSL